MTLTSAKTAVIGLFLLAASLPATAQPPVVVTTLVNFSDLDGGPQDLDGVENGVFTANGLTVRNVGAIIIDVAQAGFNINGDLVMQNSGAIRTPSIPTMDPGPALEFFITGSLNMKNDALIRSHGVAFGGSIHATIFGHLVMRDRARIEANSTAEGGTGGEIEMTVFWEIVMWHTTTRIMACGMNGGSVKIISTMAATCPAIAVRGMLKAVGFDGEGGLVEIAAFNGGVGILDDGVPRIAAIGTESAGAVKIFAFKDVTPDQPFTQPPAMVTELGNPCGH